MADAPIRIAAVAFNTPDQATAGYDGLKWLSQSMHLEIEGHAVITKDSEGKVTLAESKDADPGAARGGVVGGTVGFMLALFTGPIGVAAIGVGAATGAVAAHLRDSGFPDRELQAIGDLMQKDRSVLLVALKAEYADRLTNAIETLPEFAGRLGVHYADITDTKALGDAVTEYRRLVRGQQ